MVGVLAVFAVVTQWVAAEDPRIHLWPLLSPFLLLALPVMALVAALTVLFETIPWLRGGFGNVAWFFLWTAMMAVPVANPGNAPDPIGMTLVAQDMQDEVDARFGKADRGFVLGGMTREDEAKAQVFRWQGMDWTPELVLGRLSWFALAVGISLIAALFFDRFDPAKGRMRLPKRKRKRKEEVEEAALPALPEHVTLTPLAVTAGAFRFPGVLAAELRLALKGQPWWWYAAAAGLIIAGLTAPVGGVRQIVLPLAWIWPLLVWSPMGNRESRFGTGELLFSAPHPVGRQLPAVWMAGVLVAAVVGGGVATRYLIGGDFAALAAWTVGALFIPSLA
ncbi:MAG TPA: hypothetical protein VEG34_04635, partial [Thermoanaerobaculia bacterium]|nr:hypothetical protein [Thermoanaerobaculia bacterium]